MTQASEPDVEPFSVDVPEEELDDLRQRIADTWWPEEEQVSDSSQGVQLATIQELARYWETEHDFDPATGEVAQPQCAQRTVRASLGEQRVTPTTTFQIADVEGGAG